MKNIIFLSENFQFLEVKFSIYFRNDKIMVHFHDKIIKKISIKKSFLGLSEEIPSSNQSR